jgi:hypothetical protein
MRRQCLILLLAHDHCGRSFLGADARAYPAHFAAFACYHMELRSIPERHPIPEPIRLAAFEQFLERSGWARAGCGARREGRNDHNSNRL